MLIWVNWTLMGSNAISATFARSRSASECYQITWAVCENGFLESQIAEGQMQGAATFRMRLLVPFSLVQVQNKWKNNCESINVCRSAHQKSTFSLHSALFAIVSNCQGIAVNHASMYFQHRPIWLTTNLEGIRPPFGDAPGRVPATQWETFSSNRNRSIMIPTWGNEKLHNSNDAINIKSIYPLPMPGVHVYACFWLAINGVSS